ncbi:hypothetical protein [Pseudomonas aeruginosa]|uniref:hypothetical protein n=1 Tax=Pseudomonas aeruginosa TaxID=287 RepID=UPI000EB2417D|nr:hypothetical protein [Pseudomonas aeruginosa]
MKLSDSFDARRLRPRRPRVWRWRLAAAFAALVASLGVLLSLALGLLSLCLGVFLWRFSRRRSRRNSDLSLSPNLMKKRD